MNQPQLSPHLGSSLNPSPTLHINERVAALWSEGRRVLHLGFGESRFPVHPLLQQALAENAHQSSYLPGAGLPELRSAAASYYANRFGGGWSASDTIVAPGSKAILFALLLALDGDLILPTPSWVSYAPQASLLGKKPIYVPANPRQFHRLEPDALDQTLAQSQSSQKVLILNSPNNPSSQTLSESEMGAISDLCRRHNVWCLSDELYGCIRYSDQQHLSMSRLYPEQTVVLAGLSKHLSLGGWRLGIGLFPPNDGGQMLLAAVNRIGSEIWSCAPAPVQYAALTAFSGESAIEQYIAECTAIHEMRTRYLWQRLEDLDIPCARPEGGFYLFPNFDGHKGALASRGIHTAEDLAAHLLEELNIATLPGSVFGTPPGELSLRLSASYIDMETSEAAEQILQAARSGLDEETLMQEHHPNMNEALTRLASFLDTLYP